MAEGKVVSGSPVLVSAITRPTAMPGHQRARLPAHRVRYRPDQKPDRELTRPNRSRLCQRPGLYSAQPGDQASWDHSGEIGITEDIGVALVQNPDLKALVVHGYHDRVTHYFMSLYTLVQTTRARGARERLYFGTYPGGHMFYLQSGRRSKFFKDIEGFFAE